VEKPKQGPVTAEERRDYRARMGSNLKWGRPTEKTAEFVWTLLKDMLPVQLDNLMPKRGKQQPPTGTEYEQDVHIAKQSLVVALDCAITAGNRGAMLTKNLLFDALARRWSRSYRRAQRRGARVSYDMRPETVERALRQLLFAGVRFDTLWKIVVGRGNPLYSVSRVSGNDGHPLGWSVDLIDDSLALHAFDGAVENDGQYRRRGKWRLLLAEDWTPRRRRIRQKVCAERPYNIVKLGERSERVLSILEQTQVRFHVDVFREDYETLKQYLDAGHRPSTTAQRRGYRKLRSFVQSYRRVYEDTTGIQVETWIRSRFFRGANRRYHALNFGPERSPKDFRERWFSMDVAIPDKDEFGYDIGQVHIGKAPARTTSGCYIERDITVSQIQTLAVFLGLDELERLATATNPTLKEWLAEQLWTRHQTTEGGVLADGYAGPKDPRLIAFAKKHLMRFYGGALGKIIRECGEEPEKYGPGWRTTRGLWAKTAIKPGTKTVVLTKSGVTEAVGQAEQFIVTLPSWIDGLETFLAICRTLASADKDPLRGVVFPDPLDNAEIRWHHAQRGLVLVGHDEIEVHPFGKGAKTDFVSLPLGTIDRTALARFISPCLTHTLDAYLSSLVIEGLCAEVGVTNVIALHDAWLVGERLPARHLNPELGLIVPGEVVLERALAQAGKKWLLGLGVVYDRLIYYLGGNLTFGPFVRDIKSRWQARVDARPQRWPRFLAS
jgi:hypothetical protein